MEESKHLFSVISFHISVNILFKLFFLLYSLLSSSPQTGHL